MTPTVYIASAEPHRQRERQPAIDSWQTLGPGYNLVTRPALPDNLTNYADGLRELWTGPGDLYNVEHDVVISQPLLDTLARCPMPACCYTYWISPATSGLGYPILVSQVDHVQLNLVPDWQNCHFVDYTGPGCVKIAASVRAAGMPERVAWNRVEFEINRIVQQAGYRWHLHYPILEHLHGFRRV